MGMTMIGRAGARRLYGKLYLVYLFTMTAAVTLANAENLLVLDVSFSELLFSLTTPGYGGAVLMASLLMGWSLIRLRFVFAASSVPSGDRDDTTARLTRLLKHPYELLVGASSVALLTSFIFHAVEIATARFGTSEIADVWVDTIIVLIGEVGMALAVAVFLFSTVRALIRPYILELKQKTSLEGKKISFVIPLILAYSSTFLLTLYNLFQLAVIADDTGSPHSPLLVGGISLFFFVFGIVFFVYVTFQFRCELNSLVELIRDMAKNGKRRRGIRMPVISNDEAGELAAAFNELQERMDREYESLDRELKLAYNVQQKLLPPGDLTLGAYHITARCRPYREVGGDFFDVVTLGPNKFAVMIGDVSGKGVPAALLMSALLLLFRAEIKRNYSPAEVLARMNRQLCEAMGDDGAVTIGVGVIDSSNDTLSYSSAGHLSPYIVDQFGKLTAIENSSLPIGFDSDIVYQEQKLQLQPGDRLFLYTDGIIESVDGRGKMYGFEGLEQEISSWHIVGDLPRLVDEWLERMDERTKAENDDRTIVVLELVQAYHNAASPSENKGVTIGEEQFPNMMTHEISLRSRVGTERQAAEEIGELLVHQWPETELREDLQSAVAEAIMNAMEHGNKFDPIKQVAVHIQIASLLAVIRIYDEGGGYFPHVSRDEDEMRKKRESDDPRGWGLVIIDSLADYWATGRDERGFYIELYFMRKMDAEREQQGV